MKPRALVIEDNEASVREVQDILDSLDHRFDAAGDQDAARKLLGAGKYDYILLDLQIPVKPGKLSRVQNGINLLTQIRGTAGMEAVPIIVMTAHGNDGPRQAVDVFKRGAVDYVTKPFTRDELDRAIQDAITKGGTAAPGPRRAKPKPPALTPFKNETRVMVIGEDSVKICGIEIWRATFQPDMHKILVRLSQREGGGYARINGSKLMRELGRDASNPVGRPIKSFRDTASERLAEHRHLECGLYDIIARGGGGYHFTDWMDVRLAGQPAPPKANPAPAKKPAKAPDGPRLNDRQKWILQQLAQDVPLRNKAIVKHTGKDRSTINRDLKELHDRGMIETHPEGYYTSTKRRALLS